MSVDRSHPPRARGRARQLRQARAELFAGLYDGSSGRSLRPVARAARRGRVRLLNPECRDEDSSARRFALLEIE